MTLTGMLFTDS